MRERETESQRERQRQTESTWGHRKLVGVGSLHHMALRGTEATGLDGKHRHRMCLVLHTLQNYKVMKLKLIPSLLNSAKVSMRTIYWEIK